MEQAVGVGKTVDWPTGITANGNEGVAGEVKQNPGAIGYAQLAYGIQEILQYGSVQNRDGEFIEPHPGAVTAAAERALSELPDDLRFSITNSPGRGSYPISTTTWAIVYTSASGQREGDHRLPALGHS